MRDNSKILAAGMAINMPAIADPLKSEAYEREMRIFINFKKKPNVLLMNKLIKLKGVKLEKRQGAL